MQPRWGSVFCAVPRPSAELKAKLAASEDRVAELEAQVTALQGGFRAIKDSDGGGHKRPTGGGGEPPAKATKVEKDDQKPAARITQDRPSVC